MLAAIQRVAGVNKPVVQDEARFRPEKSEVMALVCDYRKAKATFGYEPRVEFEEGLARLRDYVVAQRRRPTRVRTTFDACEQ